MSDVKKGNGKSSVLAMNPKTVIARKDYKCETCNGEFPIMKGLPYISLPIKINGTVERKKICFRCWYALCDKLRHGGKNNVNLSSGALRWAALGRHFKEKWNWYINLLDALREAKTEEEKQKYQTRIDEMEYDMSLMEEPEEKGSQTKINEAGE